MGRLDKGISSEGENMKKLYWSAVIYTVLGLVSGLYYREITKAEDFTGSTQLSVMHTHLLALGTLLFLILIALEKVFALTQSKVFPAFFWIYNAGLLITVAIMGLHGTRTVLGESSGAAISGIAGLGHILLTVALVLLFIAVYRRLFKAEQTEPVAAQGS